MSSLTFKACKAKKTNAIEENNTHIVDINQMYAQQYIYNNTEIKAVKRVINWVDNILKIF